MKWQAYIVICLTFLVYSCLDESNLPLSKDYPILATENPSDINSSGVTVSGSIIKSGSDPIIRYGFAWSEGENNYEIEIPIGELSDQFKYRISSDLKKEVEYNYHAFVETQKNIILGNQITFVSQGTNLPEIHDFNPKHGNSGDTIVITGANFSLLKSRIQVLLGQDIGQVVSTSLNEIKFYLPLALIGSGEVPLELKSGETIIQHSELFNLDTHVISDFHPSEGIIGETEIEITGEGFEVGNNIVRIGGYEATIIDESSSKINVMLPYSMETGMRDIEVQIKRRVTISNKPIKIISRWKKLDNFPSSPRATGHFAVLNNSGYLIGGRDCGDLFSCDMYFSEAWNYDFSLDKWTSIPTFPGTPRSSGVGFSFDDQIYYGLGINNYNINSDFWSYDIQNNSWSNLKDFPGSPRYDPIYFLIDGIGYLVGGLVGGSPNSEVWRYEMGTDQWTLLGEIDLVNHIDGRNVFFQSTAKAYVLLNNKIYEFDPSDPSFLLPFVDLPFDHDITKSYIRHHSFVIDDDIYIGYTDFWKYSKVSNGWSRIESFPSESRSHANAFSFNNVGYVMFGFPDKINAIPVPEVWIYDPSIEIEE